MPTMHMARDATDVTDGEWMEAGGRPEATRRFPRCCCCIRHTALNPWPWRPSFDQTIVHIIILLPLTSMDSGGKIQNMCFGE
jgi:hypothetical protein